MSYSEFGFAAAVHVCRSRTSVDKLKQTAELKGKALPKRARGWLATPTRMSETSVRAAGEAAALDNR